jgi:hypothetical protein
MPFAGSEDRHSATQPVARFVGWHEQDRRRTVSDRLGAGSMACPRCDAPVSIGAVGLAPGHPLACPYCDHSGPLREFLSLALPTRPARVVVRVTRAVGGPGSG